MSQPYGFSWIEKPFLAASAMPHDETELAWLRDQGIDIVLTLTEQALPRKWIDNQGLMNVHVPIEDMTVPTTEDIEKCLRVIQKARDSNMGIMVHCLAGKGRTGTVLALYLVSKGMPGDDAINHIRMLRPGSVETEEQRRLIQKFAQERNARNDTV